MECPHTHGTLEVRDAQTHIGYACSECGGVWLPYKYVDALRFTYAFSSSQFYDALACSGSKEVAERCPFGCGPLTRVNHGEQSVSWCRSCRGVWFESGDLAALIRTLDRLDGVPTNGGRWLAAEVGGSLLAFLLGWPS